MPSLENPGPTNSDSAWLGIVKIALAQIVVLIALAGAAVFYVNWSSQAALAAFPDATELSLPAPGRHAQSVTPVHQIKGPQACLLRA